MGIGRSILGGLTLRISGTMAVVTMKHTMMARKVSAKVRVSASR